MPRIRRARCKLGVKLSNWRDGAELRLYDSARSLTDSLFTLYRNEIKCPSCDTYKCFYLCSNGGGRASVPVFRRYKHFCPIGNSIYMRNGHRHRGKVFTVGVPDMLMNFIMPILEGVSRGKRTQSSGLARKRLVACHGALDQLKKSGRKVDAGNLAERLAALGEMHGDVSTVDDEWQDEDEDFVVEIDTSHAIATRRHVRSVSINGAEDATLLTALQAGLLLGHPRWEPRPTGSIAPEDRRAESFSESAVQGQQAQVNSISETRLSANRRTEEVHDATIGREDIGVGGWEGDRTPATGEHEAFCPQRHARRADRESIRTPSTEDDSSTFQRQTPEIDPVHVRISYIDACGQTFDDWPTLLEHMDRDEDRLDICMVANINTNAILNSLADSRLSSCIVALSPLSTEGDETMRAPGMLLLAEAHHRSRFMVLSITPYTCTFRVCSRTVHAVYLPPRMGALDAHNLFTSFFKLPGGLRPDVILGDLHVDLAPDRLKGNGSPRPWTRSQNRPSQALNASKSVTLTGRAKVVLAILNEYGLKEMKDQDDRRQLDGLASLPPAFNVELRRQIATLYAFVSSQDNSEVEGRLAYGYWRATDREQALEGMVFDFI